MYVFQFSILLFLYRSVKFLNELCEGENISEEIETLISEWQFSSLTEFSEIRDDLHSIISQIIEKYLKEGSSFKIVHKIHW